MTNNILKDLILQIYDINKLNMKLFFFVLSSSPPFEHFAIDE